MPPQQVCCLLRLEVRGSATGVGAVCRAMVLLGYLDVEAGRLFGGRANNHHLRKLFTDVGGFLKQGKQAQQQVSTASACSSYALCQAVPASSWTQITRKQLV